MENNYCAELGPLGVAFTKPFVCALLVLCNWVLKICLSINLSFETSQWSLSLFRVNIPLKYKPERKNAGLLSMSGLLGL